MRSIFKNSEIEEEFRNKGFVKLPFLNSDEVEQLKGVYFETLEQSGGRLGMENENYKSHKKITYDFTFIDKSVDYKKMVFDSITEVFESKYAEILDDYEPIIANYIRKKPFQGEVPLHQNWSFVDEKKFTSISIWCPLTNSNKDNGTLQVIPGSHKRFGRIRGPKIASELDNIESLLIEKYLEPLEVKAGEIIILDDSIIHYSSENKTNDLRLAIQLIMIPSETDSIHYHKAPEKEFIETLCVDHEFYMNFDPWKNPSPDTKVIKKIKHQVSPLTEDEFNLKMSSKPFDSLKWYQRIFS